MGRRVAQRYRDLVTGAALAELDDGTFASVLEELQSLADLTVALFVARSEPAVTEGNDDTEERLRAQAELLAIEWGISLTEANRLVAINQQNNGARH
jgi:hypothetical protein